MDEAHYRESRLCRLLGNPIVYQLVVLLKHRGALTPSMLAELTGRSVQTVSEHLGKLRAADVVRYDSKGRQVRYWLKHKTESGDLLKVLRRMVHASSSL
jgi:DNA-binding transcriptional ArsR family regulator